MKPVFVDGPNESLSACVASLFNQPLFKVPRLDMLRNNPTWLQQLNQWTNSFGSRWVVAFLMQDKDGNVQNKLWTPPGWYIEGAESDDGKTTVFQVCSGGVVVHLPFQPSVKVVAKMRLWMVVVDPAVAWPD